MVRALMKLSKYITFQNQHSIFRLDPNCSNIRHRVAWLRNQRALSHTIFTVNTTIYTEQLPIVRRILGIEYRLNKSLFVLSRKMGTSNKEEANSEPVAVAIVDTTNTNAAVDADGLDVLENEFKKAVTIVADKPDQSNNNHNDEHDEVPPPPSSAIRMTTSEKVPEEVVEGNFEVSKSLRRIASLIDDAKNILILSGAGVSVAAGIPDFRTPGTGLYDNLQKYNLPYAEAVFDIQYYQMNPKPFVQLAAELWPDRHRPTITHSFIALLADKQRLLRNYTQVCFSFYSFCRTINVHSYVCLNYFFFFAL
jgi:hypothetical protein